MFTDPGIWSRPAVMVFRSVDIALYCRCDVTSPESVHSASLQIKEHFKGVSPSILVNNAGIGHDFPIFSPPIAKLKKLIDVNLTSHWITCAEFCPGMVKRNKGHVVEVASMSSFVSVGRFSDYSAGKAALISFSESESAARNEAWSSVSCHSC